MLTYESLIEQAKLRGLPVSKLRGILREYLQILILKQIYKLKEGKKLYFTGGTYLRLVHNFKRFSEDLDFDTDSLRKSEFKSLLENLIKELKRIGIESKVTFNFWDNVYSSKIAFPKVEETYKVSSQYSKKQGIVIKIETNKSHYKLKFESNIISGFGEVYPVICTARGITFANKIDALIKKERGRHIYDFIFMLSNDFPVDKKTLFHLGLKDDLQKEIINKINSFSKSQLKNIAENLRPFLFDESEADLIEKAQEVIPKMLEKHKLTIL